MSAYRIPFNRPALVGTELDHVRKAIEGGHSSGDGPYTKRCSEMLEDWIGVERALLTTSCTHALEMCALLLDLQPGDEVIVPSFAFVTTAGAFALHGATPVFADVRRDTLNLDESRLRAALSERTKAIVALHYGGVACEMDEILAIAEEAGVAVVEDNAHGLFGTYKGRKLGSLGALATQSFHETKNFTCGEGGALLLGRRDWVERAEIIREKGTNRSRFLRGQVDKYTWVDLGSSYLPSEILAAFLYGQFEGRETVQSRRDALWRDYQEGLADWAASRGVGTPHVPEHATHPSHLYYLMMPSLEARTRLIDHLAARGILAVFHYQPLHLSEMGRRFGGQPGQCPVTEEVADRLVRLPLYWGMTPDEQAQVLEAVRSFDP